ncbi:hypothetical protein FCL47_18625 [Desulfopila sp. IMCC35006]|uniref:YhaN family protein n=1 Tax=Desulfopila sp. IMCC35006 TaxID=2569542 RepID=UPI0010AC2B7A|nr:YhaN family protein [Desulfopila sp. IMCC35006]TKB24498.1 hypothetical protein FCL47_18625 [Desulfopila sp. IMCC35006]
MRIKRLHLKAVGPFTDRTLHFDSKEPGLHIIYGPNEAGKSSSLRALKALLYGFPQQTPDNFLHNYDQLLVGGCIVNSSGEELTFWRRKKRIGDIIDEAGNPLPANILRQFLHGVEPEIFASLYGIDHEMLLRGGEEILAQKGEVGQALFAAGAGISSLRQVTEQLEQEAAELFKSTGQLPKINKAIKNFKELQKEAKTVSLSCKDWKDLRSSLKIAEKERAILEKERDHNNKELRRLERLAQAIPEIASLQAYRAQREDLGEVTLLPPNFTENYRRVVQAIREAELQLQKDTERLDHLQTKRQALSFNRDLLSQAEKVDDLHQRLGEYRKGLKDKPEREGMRISLRREAADLLQQVRPDLSLAEIEPLRSVLMKKKTVQRLSEEYAAINQQLMLAQKQYRVAEQEHQEANRSLAAMPATASTQNSGKLLQVVKMARKEGNIDAMLEKNRHEIEQSKKDCLIELKRHGHWSGDLQMLAELPLPLAQTVHLAETRYSDIDEQRRALEKEQKYTEHELQKTRAEIKKGTYTGEIPSEAMLYKIRDKREQGWQLLRRQWLDDQDTTEESLVYAPDQPVADAYEVYVQEADVISDRLRREADRIAGAAALRAQAESLQSKLTDLAQNKAMLEQRQQDLDTAWKALWQPVGITPLSPKEMSGWLTAIDRLRYKTADILKKELDIERAALRREALRQAVQQEIQALHPLETTAHATLGPTLALAENLLDTLANRQAEREKATERLAAAQKNVQQAQQEVTSAQQALAKWQEQWDTATSGLGLPGRIATSEANELIDIIQSCFDRVKEAADLKKRIDGIDRDAQNLDNDVRSLLEKVAPTQPPQPLDQAILHLRTLLSQSQKDCTLHDKLSEEIDSLQTEVSGTRKTLLSAAAQMEEILRIAKSDTQEDLTAAMRKFEEYRKLSEKISDIQANLAKISAGISIEEITTQAAEINGDELAGRIEAHRRDITERIHPEINRISQIIGEQTSKLAAMDGSDRAAELSQEMEQELARMRRLAERYTLVKLASKILQLEIERYREEHQDPVLIIGSRYFRDMTLGSFTGLRTDIDDKGAPILIGIRPEDRRIPVGGMSSGTRDQLYLALRLATLEYRLESHEPMPFIVDDILINFDDERSRATLQALARLAARNQVILFTHHRQIVDEADKCADKGTVVVHTL